MFVLIGIGLHDAQDISLNGLAFVKRADIVYLDAYTSPLQCSVQDLEQCYDRSVTAVEREFIEDGTAILSQAAYQAVVLLIVCLLYTSPSPRD